MGLSPAFSAKVKGMISKASAKDLMIILLTPSKVRPYAANFKEIWISGAPPPGIIPFSLTNDLTTHKASCMDLSVSSIIWKNYLINLPIRLFLSLK